MDNSLNQKISNLVRYRVNYRLMYEKQLKEKGKITSKACIVETSPLVIEVAKWVSGAILAGVTYDVAKTAFVKFIGSLKPTDGTDKEFVDSLNTEDKSRLFFVYVSDALTGKRTDSIVEDVITEEIYAHEASKHVSSLLPEHPEDESPEELAELTKGALIKAYKKAKEISTEHLTSKEESSLIDFYSKR